VNFGGNLGQNFSNEQQAPIHTILDYMQHKITNENIIVQMLLQFKGYQNSYKVMCPLKRVKGKIFKVHRLKFNSYQRYVYINPIEGVMISYNGVSKFPHQPNYIVKLVDIQEISDQFQENLWFFKKDMHYLKIKTPSKEIFFYTKSKELTTFWMQEISLSRNFYQWLTDLINLRYRKGNKDKETKMKADELMNIILGMNLPEVDVDAFIQKQPVGMSIEEFALLKVQEYRESISANVLDVSSNNS